MPDDGRIWILEHCFTFCKPVSVCRDPEDHRWKLGPGVEEPVRLDLTTQERKRALQYTIKYKGDR
jgi:hypothetical protein